MINRFAGRVAGLTIALALAATPAAAAGPANVTVRVEGAQRTLVEETRLATTSTPVNKTGREGESCSGTSVAGALEVATSGDWSGAYNKDFGTYFVDTIKGEKHGGDPDYWTFWVNDKAAQQGICQVELQEGDEVLFFLDYCTFDPQTFECTNEPVRPLELRVPASARAGETVQATVVRFDAAGAEAPVAGARVAGDGFDGVTGSDGRVTVPVGAADLRLRAEKPNHARSTFETICVTRGDDGRCGTRDVRPPVSRIQGIADQQRIARGDAPRELRGTVEPDVSGLRHVKLRLTRKAPNGRCSYFSGRQERFRPIRCGRGHYFAIGDRADWSYLLPSVLKPGRYVFDAVAIDKAGNRDPLARGRNRVVVHVR